MYGFACLTLSLTVFVLVTCGPIGKTLPQEGKFPNFAESKLTQICLQGNVSILFSTAPSRYQSPDWSVPAVAVVPTDRKLSEAAVAAYTDKWISRLNALYDLSEPQQEKLRGASQIDTARLFRSFEAGKRNAANEQLQQPVFGLRIARGIRGKFTIELACPFFHSKSMFMKVLDTTLTPYQREMWQQRQRQLLSEWVATASVKDIETRWIQARIGLSPGQVARVRRLVKLDSETELSKAGAADQATRNSPQRWWADIHGVDRQALLDIISEEQHASLLELNTYARTAHHRP